METSQPDPDLFSVRIVSVDYYMAPPITDVDFCYSSFQGGKVNEVPVVRVYGSTPAGQKTCLHVHRALPYLYVPCSSLIQASEEGDRYLRDMSSAIEKALKSKTKSSSGSKRQHVHGCSLVRARKFYGFHSSEDLFVKIYLKHLNVNQRYYPQEVARVATLLLDGAILDRSYQPHESHIPYLLQFLVDYNLFGMGHLHLSKVKFRYPLPEEFISRAARRSDLSGHATVKMACTSGKREADSCTHSCPGLSVWTCTTIPSGWMWPPAVTSNSSPDDACFIKRQSACELEADATVDEIVNQQKKMYTSLSQTRSEVKMVQSLVPIWQEEYERTGMHEQVVIELSKPLPQNVLRTFSHGSECENALMDLCREAEKSSSSQVTHKHQAERFLQSIRSLADVGNICGMGEHVNLNFVDSVSSQGSLSEQGDSAGPSELRHSFPEIGPANEDMASSDKIDNSDTKGIDTEALGLLKWLASSQADDELNTDDELGYDLILTPLLPKTAIGKILEKANLDYECESQQECQDILDSVVDMESHMLKEQALQSTSDKPSTAVNIIPQVDGSCDDQVTGCSGNVPEINLNKEKGKSSQRAQQGIDVSARNEKKKRTRLWGPLPLASQHKVGEDSESSSFDSADVSEMKICTSSSANKDDVSCDDAVNCVNTSKFVLKEQKELAGGSVRDLMRRKRYRRFEHSELGTGESNPFHVGIKQDQMSIRPKKLEFLVKDDDREVKMAIGTSGKQLASDQETTAYERSLNLEKCEETCTYGVRPADGDIPTYGGLPLVSCIDSSFEDGTSKTGYVTSHKQRHNFENFGVPSGTQSMLPDVSLLHSETKEVQKSLISVKLDTNTDSGQLECPKDEKLESFSRFLMSTEKWRPDICSVTIESSEAPLNAVVLQIEKSTIEPIICTSSCPSALVEAPSEAMHTKCIEMSFIQKPPTVDWRSWTLENTQFAPILHDQTFIEKKTSNGTLGCHSGSQEFEGSYAEDIIPFFSDDVKDGEEYHEFYRTENVIISSQEAGLGIPTHFQNDGSLLYLLTTVNSAPSVNCVHEWLFHNQPRRHTTGTAVESTHSKFLDSASPSRCNSLQFSKESAFGDDKGASELPKLHAALTGKSDIRNSQEILLKVSPGSLLKSGSVNYKKPFVEQLSPPNPTDLKTETTNQDFTTKHHGEAAILKGNERTESQQDVSQISGPYMRSKLTPLSQIGFRDPASVGDGQQLTLMSIEVQAESRGDLRPDPRFDAITIIAIMIQEDNDHSLDAFVLLCGGGDESNGRNLDGISGCTILVALEEKHLFHHFVKIVRSYDPDVLMGWEIQGSSLGFLAERAAHLGIKLLENISRTPSSEIKVPAKNFTNQETAVPEDVPPEALFTDPTTFEDSIIEDEWGRTHASGVHVGGRIVLNIWRLIRGEIKLNIYTIDAVAEEVLRRKVPTIPPRILMQWFSSGPGRARYRCIEYILGRAKLNLEILNQLDMINRTSELARVFGIDFFSVLSRGSQYRVESMFLRLAHTQNYLAVSPGNQQVASQPAMECLPLVMEPESNFYADPVVVLDFQSLYPSMIIAYNLCFCTCLGKVLPAKPNTLGVSSFLPDSQLLADLKDKILLTPNGVMYVPSEVRKGVLPRLLEEILSTRIMVKQAMKNLTTQRVLHRIFNARQLALKLISNVTYGYTAAGFSGRMPCAELADSIVQCGRRTLESAISFVNSHEKWNARVVYGDTDSMFVLLRGRTVKESFGIGQEIASVITSMNPDPVTLKMEKVYHPCFLLTKKRYVGYSYENMDQTEPFFDAKGIETVRRDSCGAVAKTMEQSLRFFFEHQDISKVKVYLQRQWTRILAGRVSLQDFVFAKEVRLGTYSAGSSSLPPAAIVATKAMKCDPRAEPRYGERIPYVVIHGEPGARLVDMVVDPMELLAIESPFRMNDSYYINKQIIPALQRVFGIVGADLRQCFLEMPRHMRPSLGKQFSYAPNGQKMRIDSYYLSSHCFLCGELVQASKHLCDKCFEKESAAATAICSRTSRLEMDIDHLAAICRHCGGGDWIVESGIKCVSLACTLFYERRKVQKELQSLSAVATEMGFYPKCMPEWF